MSDTAIEQRERSAIEELVSRLRLGGPNASEVSDEAADLIESQQREIETLRGAIRADDERLRDAGLRVGIIAGCDTPDAMADEIASLTSQLEEARARIAELERGLEILATPETFAPSVDKWTAVPIKISDFARGLLNRSGT